ncbi:MAG: glutaminyl-tRNA synthetase [Acidimicrobiales bacterium]
MSVTPEETEHPSDFIRDLIRSDNDQGTYGARVQTRFPPEPNGFLHIGHAKAICLNFGVASEFGGTCNLRFDDTNPEKESDDFVKAIQRDLQWLGFNSDQGALFASDYFEQLYLWAEDLINQGLAYVDDQDAEAISENRGDFTTPGSNSPFRERSTEENLDLFRRMRAGEFGDGERVLRAKVDMASPNMSMRDPLMYRIRHVTHHRTGDDWCIYPNYDWAHGQSDAIEGVTHSFCTLEFENNRELYNWFLDKLDLPNGQPRQTEFGRLGLTHLITSKRKLAALVESGKVEGWDDAQMSTLSGMRRRGYPAKSIREFCDHISVGRVNGTTEVELLESFVRTELNKTALRRMAVLDPLKMVITNWPTDDDGAAVVEMRDVINNPEDEGAGTRQVPFSGELWIERDDFMVDPPKKFFRLAPGREVRLRAAYFVTCTEVVTDDEGNVTEVHVTYDPETAGGQAPDGRKVKATMHWVSAATALEAEVRLYDRLFLSAQPSGGGADPLDDVNPDSMSVVANAMLEPGLADTPLGDVVQFERIGYFAHDADRPLIFHRTVGLRDEWARIQKRNG